MINKLQKILNILERINNSLSSPIIAVESIEREKYHLKILKEREKEFNNLLNTIEKIDFKDQESACNAFLPLYSYIQYTAQVAETIYEFTRIISSNYAQIQELSISDD